MTAQPTTHHDNGGGAMPGPYAQAWEAYQDLGWQGVLPLPERRKHHPPRGFTGATGAWPTYADCWCWADDPAHEDANIALRLPDGIIGIDVDAYDGKPGAATLERAEHQWGELPATWRTTSRDDGTSGIRLYRTPTGLAWPGEVGPGIEIIQERHRYAVAPPSLHPEGRTYRWVTPQGATSTVPPNPEALPELPAAWTRGLTSNQAFEAQPRADLDDQQISAWITTQPRATEPPCERMAHRLNTALGTLTTGSAHNNANKAAMQLIRLSDTGHAGVVPALGQLHRAFLAEITRPGRPGQRETREADAEWARNIRGAVRLVAGNPTGARTCDCGGLADLLPPPTPSTETGTADGAAQAAHDDQDATERTSWWPRTLDGVLSGVEEEPPPALLTRADGVCLWYTGKVNGLLGESESGKTWVALLGVAQALAGGQRVAYFDFEDTPAGIVSRLRALGVPDTDFAHLDYIGPDETLHMGAQGDVADYMRQHQPALVVIDGVNAAMTLMGLDLNSNTDATRFTQTLLKPLTNQGAAVVAVDHVPKSKEGRGKGGIGAQAKRAMMTGCAISVEVAEPFGRGMAGRLRLYVDKDRPGFVRAECAEARFAGTAFLESDLKTGSVTVTIRAPQKDEPLPGQGPGARVRAIMESVSAYLATRPERSSLRGIRDNVQGRPVDVAEAVEALVSDGYVARSGPSSRYTHTLVRPYSALEELIVPPEMVTEGEKKVVPSGSHADSVTQGEIGRESSSKNGQTPQRGSGSVVPKWFPPVPGTTSPGTDESGSVVPTPIGGNHEPLRPGAPQDTPDTERTGNHPESPRRFLLIDGVVIDPVSKRRLQRDGDHLIDPTTGEICGHTSDLPGGA